MAHFQLAQPNAAYEEFDGEAVMLDLASGKYFSLSKSASAVVGSLFAGAAVEDIVAAFSRSKHLDQQSIDQFINQLVDYKLIELVEHKLRPGQGYIDDSLLVDEPLLVDTYDDLAEMIVADPIHEVDEERGWPVRKANG
jgi:Coenzyme PQQ synthesis protein D (PqqD)